METLHEVAEIVRTSAEAMSRDEILFYFKDMDLTKEQENMVIEYLLTPHDEEAAEEPEEPQAVEPSKAEPQELTGISVCCDQRSGNGGIRMETYLEKLLSQIRCKKPDPISLRR